MHRTVSSQLALGIILILALFAGGWMFFYTYSFNNSDGGMFAGEVKNNYQNPAKAQECRTRAFQGEAKVHGWYVQNGNEWLFAVSSEDFKNLPKYDGTEEYRLKNGKIKIIDVDTKTEKKLKATSEEKPEVITLTGYVMRCDGIPLATLNYKEGVFKKYLDL